MPSSALHSLLCDQPASQEPLTRVDLRLLHLPIRESLVASHGSHQVRELTVIGLSTGPGDVADRGWGECAALPTASYWPETAASTFALFANSADAMIGRAAIELIVAPSTRTGGFAGLPMADAAIEMAAIDLILKSADISLAVALGAGTSPVAAGAAIGLAGPDTVANRAMALANQGFRRLKLKIEPGHDVDVINLVVNRLVASGLAPPSVRIHVDANGSYDSSNDHLNIMLRLARAGVEVIEQPFPVDHPEAAQTLAKELAATKQQTLLLADEAARTVGESVAVVANGEADGIIVKPSRLGGIYPTLDLFEHARRQQFPVAIGGMLESGLGRHALAAIAALAEKDLSVIPGDLSPAQRWLAADPWDDIKLVTVNNQAEILIATTSGVAPPPDEDLLDQYTVERVLLEV